MDGDIDFELTPQRRDYPRWEVDMPGTVTFDGNAAQCRLTDLSPIGASAEMEHGPSLGTMCVVDIPRLGKIDAEVVRAEGTSIGFHFAVDETRREILLNLLSRN